MCLGSDIGKVSYPYGSHSWTMSYESYVKESVKNVKAQLQCDVFELNRKLSDPNYPPQNTLSDVEYRPDIDTTSECYEDQVSF